MMLETGWEKWLGSAADILSGKVGKIPGLKPLRPSGPYRLEFALSLNRGVRSGSARSAPRQRGAG